MNSNQQKKVSKFLSLVLRHKPETIGLNLDENGWAQVSELLEKMNESGPGLDMDALRLVVENNDKKRFRFNDDETMIRANQGHSVNVELQLAPQAPPAVLYHGTAIRNLESIRQKGLVKGQRNHVHLSADPETAIKVGQRHGKPVVLKIKAAEMQSAGQNFFLSDNGVWLTDHVAPEFIVIL